MENVDVFDFLRRTWKINSCGRVALRVPRRKPGWRFTAGLKIISEEERHFHPTRHKLWHYDYVQAGKRLAVSRFEPQRLALASWLNLRALPGNRNTFSQVALCVTRRGGRTLPVLWRSIRMCSKVRFVMRAPGLWGPKFLECFKNEEISRKLKFS